MKNDNDISPQMPEHTVQRSQNNFNDEALLRFRLLALPASATRNVSVLIGQSPKTRQRILRALETLLSYFNGC